MSGTDKTTLQQFVSGTVEPGSTIYTDDHPAYRGMADIDHETVKHSLGEYVQGPAHTNSVESVWAVLKRSVYGTWHHVSEEHLSRYVDEAAFHLNEGNCKVHSLVRIDSFVRQAFEHIITYRELTA